MIARYHARRLLTRRRRGFRASPDPRNPTLPRWSLREQRRHKVVALFFTERQKFVGHYRTELVSASIVGMRSTAAIAVEASPRISTTGGKFLAEDVSFGHTDRA